MYILSCVSVFAKSEGTTIFRKNTHTGHYNTYLKFWWSYKIAWIRSLVSRAYKICSNKTLLSAEINTILKFVSWNGFSKWTTTIIDQILRALWVFCYAFAPCPHCNVVLNQFVLNMPLTSTSYRPPALVRGEGIYTTTYNL